MLITDQMGREIVLNSQPIRIVSLVPSQTELLYDLGLENQVVGITKFCIHPTVWYSSKTKVGGTKKINFERIHSLNPDLIIGNKEENTKEIMESLMNHYPVWMSDILHLEDALDMINRVGEITGKGIEAYTISDRIAIEFKKLKPLTKPLKVAYFIWNDPFMVAGHDTFIDHVLTATGFINVFSKRESRYPEVSVDDIVAANPDVIFLSSEPYPFKEEHMYTFNQLLPNSKVMIVDGEMFSWYGSRLLKTPEYISSLLAKLI